MHKILIIDDDAELCTLLTEYLAEEGFQVTSVHQGELALDRLHHAEYDLVILDVMMPKMNGFEVLRKIRQFSSLPVLMLTARGEDVDKIVGLEMGADDYLPKPFNPRELIGRLKAILRRTQTQLSDHETVMPTTHAELNVDDINVNLEKRTVSTDDTVLLLTNTEYNILVYLLKSVNKAVSKKVLYEEILGRKMESFDRSLDVHVSNLRNKLGTNKQGHPRIKTMHGYGYLYQSIQKIDS
jgi:two-component system response regulator CpxR